MAIKLYKKDHHRNRLRKIICDIFLQGATQKGQAK